MQRAIELARLGWYTTRPNPRVGCVLVMNHAVKGEGWHERAGEAHAERRALDDAAALGHDIRGATAYVTLEPCSHTGRTPPCSEALIEAGVARVVIGAQDPNPSVDGRGIQMLEAAGIEVITGVLEPRCQNLNRGFNSRMQRGRPWVRVKLAMSLDARTADARGHSQWITGAPARDDVHRLRAESGAVMIGSGTLLADNPSLTVRLKGDWMQPQRVVLDSRLRMSPEARMLGREGVTQVFTASDDDRLRKGLLDAGALVQSCLADDNGGLDLADVLKSLAAEQINDVLVEAGPRLAGALAEAELVDEYVLYVAPMLIGDAGRALMSLPGRDRLHDALHLRFEDIQPVGDDLRIIARPVAATG
ncbi:MAG: bifunctional diaminohydroxyphosphoribosylaminopyrimidine deaminase/5-amino-6-(5-phosphoribosylamino)uracil reductase RibD [Salinisphaera sp.]|nr:bifunctional diaminohydroxyphosphoribosylaminopyrimidine deaminase/5-amino-6-(5-phosphoribosylamino)uracil reductase RibD [Salinisphaera sp.]